MRQSATVSCLLWHSHLFVGIAGACAAVWPVPGALAALLVIFCDRRFRKISLLVIALIIFSCGLFFMGFIKAERLAQADQTPEWLSSTKRVCGQIKEVFYLPENKIQILLANMRPEDAPEATPLPGYTRWTLQTPPSNFEPLRGLEACVSRPVLRQRALINSSPGQQDLLFARQVYWRIYSKGDKGAPELKGNADWLASARNAIKQKFLHVAALAQDTGEAKNRVGTQARAILLALLFGDRSFLERQSLDDFSAGGIAHSLALSGQHLGIAALAAFTLVWLAGRASPALFLGRPRVFLIALFSLPIGLVYLWLGNAPPSLLRAFCMLFLLALWLFQNRAWKGMDLVCAALLLLCCLNPAGIFDIGLQLSVLCVMVISLLGPHIPAMPDFGKFLFQGRARAIFHQLWQIFFISLAIQIFLMPLVLAHFGQTSFWFALNLLWLPVLGLIVLPLAFLSLPLAPISDQLAAFCLQAAALPCEWLLALLAWLRKHEILEAPAQLVPHWTSLFAFACLLCLFAIHFSKARKSLSALFGCLALIFLSVGPALRVAEMLDKRPQLTLLDVGQGQASLIKFDGYGRILVDGGGGTGSFDMGKRVLAPALAANYPPFLDASINSHPDMDHVGGLLTLLPYFKNGRLFHNGHELDNAERVKWRALCDNDNARPLLAGDSIILGKPENGLKLEALYPPAFGIPDSNGNKIPHLGLEGNNASLVLRLVQNGEGLAMLPGDAEIKALSQIANSDENLQTKILIAPHHGSNTGLSPEFYQKLAPDLALASCGFQNRWNFPGKKLRDFLERSGIPLLTTSEYGRMDIKFEGDGSYSITRANRDVALPEIIK